MNKQMKMGPSFQLGGTHGMNVSSMNVLALSSHTLTQMKMVPNKKKDGVTIHAWPQEDISLRKMAIARGVMTSRTAFMSFMTGVIQCVTPGVPLTVELGTQ